MMTRFLDSEIHTLRYQWHRVCLKRLLSILIAISIVSTSHLAFAVPPATAQSGGLTHINDLNEKAQALVYKQPKEAIKYCQQALQKLIEHPNQDLEYQIKMIEKELLLNK